MKTVASLPYLTNHLRGCQGVIKTSPEDFIVEELPSYEPVGAGEHVYLLIEKRGLTTQAVLNRISEITGCKKRTMGYAGLKDAHAITKQWISIHTPDDLPLQRIETPAIRILRVSRHTNKLRIGHLAGNRFDLVIRNAGDIEQVSAIIDVIRRRGFPNFFGPQRFGIQGDNAINGKRIVLASVLSARLNPHGGPPRDGESGGDGNASNKVGVHRGGYQRRLLVNAYQSALFNELVAQRMDGACFDPALQDPAADSCGNGASKGAASGTDNLLSTMLRGDIAMKHSSGGCFEVTADDLTEAQTRADSHEISPTAPLFGHKSMLATHRPGYVESKLLEREQLRLIDFKTSDRNISVKGERRSVRAFVNNLQWSAESDSGTHTLKLTFELAKGVYATSLLRELMKSDDIADVAGAGALKSRPEAPAERHANRIAGDP